MSPTAHNAGRQASCLLLSVVVLFGCAESQPQQIRELEACDDVRAQGSFAFLIRKGPEPRLMLTGPNAQLQASVTEESASGLLINVSGPDVRAVLTCPELNELELIGAVRASNTEGEMLTFAKLAAYGSSALQLSMVQADDLDLRTSGQARIEIASLLAESVRVQSSSASGLRMSGETGRLQMSLRGQARVDAAALKAQWVEVTALDESNASVQASAHLKGQVADTATLEYTGTPDLDLQTPAN